MSVSSDLKASILESLQDGKEHDIQFVKDFATREKNLKYEQDYTKGHLAGSLHSLVKNNKILKLDRGIYKISPYQENSRKKGSGDKEDEKLSKLQNKERRTIFEENKEKILKSLKDEEKRIQKYIKDVRLMDVELEDMELVNELMKVMKCLRDFNSRF